ncbi:prolipoprotein diacylglyceryl transferase [Clostridium felsineum]|uniref:Phosphatidylglycerol--prolipoprotein diacylglyceryl transferase n=1 Tax=Clostridium felsineum TaxID=36839 RepID=A0A1S8MAQ1_9CLOT|nr:prolipoprotein diacylglyceryl transferase [Clostridium felsineum]MCR3760988.1 prolipoprotein diacylglyceryl transferase [Clostridium felsineum]URZ02384.1 Phosphatidylglycerol--prolipoprotein diacylglyceryl transferase [Clostridium felsineum]URZ04875.1 Phosphatidylglycerol--prolipoprotein diacylglyceryl transferase [Clostridium felsineum]URZ09916.1 Phosphatidylglycerol--prolipoprotein diacylglyceryl transferase [Clostridium felsineum]URZ18178.1 Phosphatidylglycerol--prolipoprotein diacylglyc
MNPVAFTLFGLEIRWYGIFIATGVILGLLMAYLNSKLREVDYDSVLDIVLISLPIGIIGARLYYVIFQFKSYNGNIMDMINIRNGGLAIHGGLIFGVIAAYLVSRYKKLSFLKVMDIGAPSIILAQAMGRWGNFFNGEAHGGPVSYTFIQKFPQFIQKGMTIDGVYYNPTFLYESTWDLVIFLSLMIIIRKCKSKGVVFFAYIGLYSLGRFFIEGMRTDSLMLGPIRVAQLVSILGVVISIVYILGSYLKSKKA